MSRVPLLHACRHREGGIDPHNVVISAERMWLSVNMATAVLPGTLQAGARLTPTQLSVALIIANVILIGGYIFSGHLSQRYGRRRFFIGNGILIALAASTSSR
ncbi:MAG: hypothetical protein ACRDMV_24815 [Streptosporangiales bacterium]